MTVTWIVVIVHWLPGDPPLMFRPVVVGAMAGRAQCMLCGTCVIHEIVQNSEVTGGIMHQPYGTWHNTTGNQRSGLGGHPGEGVYGERGVEYFPTLCRSLGSGK